MRSHIRWIWGLFFLPVGFLLPWLEGFWYLRGAGFNDLAISHLPNALWIQRSLSLWGQIPLWSNTILSGYPFNANPLSGLHYPPGWLAFLFPQPLGLNIILLAHLVLGGWGMFLFLRSEGLDALPAALGAFAFEALPKLHSHLGAGHITLVYAVCWTPWLLLAENQASGRWWMPAGVLGLIALADPRWAPIAGLLWVGYAVWIWRRHSPVRVVSFGLRLFSAAALAVALAASLLLPLLQYSRLTTRADMTAADLLAYSLAPGQLLGFLAAPLGNSPEIVLYPGGLVLALALVGLALPEVRRQWFWYLVALAGLAGSLGSYLPGAEWIAGLPGLNLLRVPTRGLMAGGLALAVCAAWSLQILLRQPEHLKQMPRLNPFLVLFGLILLALALTGLGWWATGEFPVRFAWGAAALLGAGLLLFFLRAGRLSGERFVFFCLVWLILDLGISNRLAIEVRPARQVFSQGAELASFLSDFPGLKRIYSPSYSIPQQTSALYGLELADGVDPLQSRAYVEYMRPATGVVVPGYSVSVPAFSNGNPAEDNRGSSLDARLLGLLNVTFVASEFPIQNNDLSEIGRFGQTILYRNRAAYPRAWVQPGGQIPGRGQVIPAQVAWTPNRIVVHASGPGRLMLSEINLPDWRARLDGRDVPMLNAVIFRAVDLPDGEHLVEFVYHPAAFYLGVLVSALAWTGVGLAGLLRKRKRYDHSS